MLLYTKHIKFSDGCQVVLSYKGVQQSNYVAWAIQNKNETWNTECKKLFISYNVGLFFRDLLKYSLVTNWGLLLFLKGELVLESFQTIISTGISQWGKF